MSLMASLRQPALGFFSPWIILAPLTVLGFSVETAMSCLLFHQFWDFLLHSHALPKLGALEKVIMTPAHHRVHHSAQKQHYDSNMGTLLTLWDRIGGTYINPRTIPNIDEIPLGLEITHLNFSNPITANLVPILRFFSSNQGAKKMKMMSQTLKKIGALTATLVVVAVFAPRQGLAGSSFTFSSNSMPRDTQTFTSLSSVKKDIGTDELGAVEWITVSGTISSGAAGSATIKLPPSIPSSVVLATVRAVQHEAVRNCEKQALLFKSGLSGATSFVMRSYASSSACPAGGCYDLSNSQTVISCSLE